MNFKNLLKSFSVKCFAIALVSLLIVNIASAQVDLLVSTEATSDGNLKVDSIKTGKNFIFVIDYSISSLTTNGTNVKIQVPLPDNLTVAPGGTSIAYDHSQISSVTNVGGLITANFINPIPAGSTGQMQISLVYTNGTTPNGYTPLIITAITANNANASPIYDTTSTKALANNNIVLSKTAHSYSTNPTLDGPFTYDISYNNSGGAEGNLNLYHANILDTLPVGVVFIGATNFGSIVPTSTVLGTGQTVVSWDWGATTFTGSGSASITVKYTAPTFSVNSTFNNCASLTGDIPVLPFVAGVATLAAAPELRACASGHLVASSGGVSGNGSGVGSHIPGLCPGVVMAGSDANFTTGWTNSGNTTLDFVEVITNIDPNIDVTSVFAKQVKDPVPGTNLPRVKVYEYYELNNSGTWLAVSGSPFDNTTMSNSYAVTLGATDFISKVKIRVEPDVDPIGPYFSQDLTYTGTIRTATPNGNPAGTIIQGSNNPGTCAITVTGTQINNCYQLNASSNSAALPALNPCGNAHIVGQAPVFSSLNKTTTNGTSFGPTNVVTYEISAKQLGIGVAQNVSLTDVLNAKLIYQAGTAQFKLNSGGTYAPLAGVGVSGQTLTFPIANVSSGDQIFVKFDAKVVDGTAPSTIGNFATLASSNSYINAGNPNTNTKNITVISAAAYTSQLGQNGCDTTHFVYYPENAHATPQGKINYRALLRNTGNVGANNITMIDVFPFIGDVRGSQYFANLAAPITFTDPSTTIYYNTAPNPCMPEFSPAINPAGCNTANWSVTPPADITSVTAIKIKRTATIAPLDSLVYTWPMILPVGVPANITMYNSYTYQLNRTDNGAQLLPATPNKVGMITDCVSALGSLGNYAWVDSNANGLQDESVLAGINGLKVYLYKPGPSNVVGGNDQVLLDSTFTANDFTGRPGYYTFTNLATGDYYVKFPAIAGKVFTKLDQTIKTDNNSNADRSTGYSELVHINVALGGLDKDNPTIDAGYIVCTLNVTAQKTDISCNAWVDGKIDLTVTGSRGGATYTWSDGQTVKDRAFLHAGNYTVQVIDSVGCTKSVSQTIVEPIVLPAITGVNMICVDSTTTLHHAIPGGVWAINNTAIATINSSTGLLTGVGAGTAIVTYKINSGLCGTAYYYPNVQLCGPGGGVSGGGGGGLESKSLGDAVAKRIFNNAINSLQGPVDYSKLPLINTNGTRNRVTGIGTQMQLRDILPQQLSSNAYQASVSTPVDIPTITNAKEVLSVDFNLNNKAKAVAFATKTLGEVYDHTKSICDRLKGSELIGMQNVMVNGISLVRYDLKNTSGVNEYAISFVIGAKSGRNSYTVQSTWLNKDYASDEVMYNIQLWAVNTGLLMDMATDVLTRLKASLPIDVITSNATLPKTYVTIGKREGTNLNLAITNNQTVNSGYFEISETAHEQGISTTRKVPFTLDASGKSNVSIPVSDNYEASIGLYLNNQLQDLVFMADGTWGYDYNKATSTVKEFNISNDANINKADTANFMLFRNMQLTATSPDYISIYKVLRGAGAAQNLSDFKTFQFNASGEGTNLHVTLVKNGITNWADQYSYTLPLTKDNKDYKISLSDFTSTATKEKIDASDLTMALFSFEVASARNSSINGSISAAAFTKEDIAYNNSLQSKEIAVFPNPSSGRFNAIFKSDKTNELTLKVTNASTGKLMFTKTVNAVKGENKVQVDITDQSLVNICVLTLEGANTKYEPKKVIINKQ